MPTTTLNASFDGVTPVTTLVGTQDWDSAKIYYYSQFEFDPANSLIANVTLSGADWRAEYVLFGDSGVTSQLNLSDLDELAGRRIEILTLGYNSDVNLTSTRVDFFVGWDGALHDIALGSANTKSVNVFADHNIIFDCTINAFSRICSLNSWCSHFSVCWGKPTI